MDSNGQKFWLLADAEKFALADSQAEWEPQQRVLRLKSKRVVIDTPTDRTVARTYAGQVRTTMDTFGTWASISSDRTQVLAFGTFEESVIIYESPENSTILDLSLGSDSILYIVIMDISGDSAVVMLDRRERWTPITLQATGFNPTRVAAHSEGGAWLLDSSTQTLASLRGQPLRDRPAKDYQADVARPCEENVDAPRIEIRTDLVFPSDREIVAMAANPNAEVGFLLWPLDDFEDAEFIRLSNNELSNVIQLEGSIAPFSLGWVDEDRWAFLFANYNEAVIYDFDKNNPATLVTPAGDRYPLNGWTQQPFCNALSKPVHYPASLADNNRPRPLHRLSLPNLAKSASVRIQQPIDSGNIGTQWHRLYIEAAIPPGTGFTLLLSAADDLNTLAKSEEFSHCFGNNNKIVSSSDAPKASWNAQASEIPFHCGLLKCQREKDRSGLFTVLIQRCGKSVRTLRGRYLNMRILLNSNGGATAEIAAIRVYGPRFSYLDNYLPELYRETAFGSESEVDAAATPADFLQRYLGLFESVLTPLEDKIAAAHLVTDPISAPDDALEWLGKWIALSMEPGLPIKRKRRMLSEATRLYRLRGTLRGLSLALNIVTGDMVANGGIVILEDFRLRRTFATILGADLTDEEDPLLQGIVSSGNSYVGDTLFLGDEEKKEFLALYGPDIATTKEEQSAVEAFFERLAFRITVLAHRQISKEQLGLIRRIVALETPAHVETRILAASRPLLVGLSALVGVDTNIGTQPPPKPVKIGDSVVGRKDYILGLGSLDPRLEGAGSSAIDSGIPPIAYAPDVDAEYGGSFTLDASESQAFGGRVLSEYHWTFENGGE